MRKTILTLMLVATALTAAGDWRPDLPADGVPALTANVRSNWDALALAVGSQNLLADPAFLIWAAGNTVAPSHWNVTGTGTIARTGPGAADTTTKVGGYSIKLIPVSGAHWLSQQILSPTGMTASASFLAGQTMSCGAWVKTSQASHARIWIFDVDSSTISSYHPGDGQWRWITVTHVLHATPTSLGFYLRADVNGFAAYFSGPTCVLGPVPPSQYMPAPFTYARIDVCHIAGNVSTGTDKCRAFFPRPVLIRDVALRVRVAPATTAITVDANNWETGTGWVSMFSTRPTIAATALHGGAPPDGTYTYRCVFGMAGATALAGGNGLSFDIDTVGTGTVGADLTISVGYLMYAPPLSYFNGYNEWR